MKVKFTKYHALYNDFIIVESKNVRLPRKRLPQLALKMCARHSGVGADGLLFISTKGKKKSVIEVYNADGGWAEKSGNGLRIAGLHFHRKKSRQREFKFQISGTANSVKLIEKTSSGAILRTELGIPKFRSKDVPIKVPFPFMINQSLKMGGVNFPVTCLSIGNPHTVMIVENFDFDWKTFGKLVENNRLFPKKTNVEFVKVLSRSRLQLCEWERGVGATGSSGTGAAAAVAAAVVLGMAERKCTVDFEKGSLLINWRESDNIIELTGPVQFICQGIYEFI